MSGVLARFFDTAYLPLSYTGNPGVYGVSHRGFAPPLRYRPFTPELQWQSRGKYRISQGRRNTNTPPLRYRLITPVSHWQPRGQ